MFHWICPECGREIAPGVKECPACDPQAPQPVQVHLTQPLEAPAAEAVLVPEVVLVPELVEADPEARLREMVGRMLAPGPPMQSSAPRVEAPVGRSVVRPLSVESSSPVGAPPMVRMLAPKIPEIAERLHDSTLRIPQEAAPPPAAVRGAITDARRRVAGGEVALPRDFGLNGKPVERAPDAAPLENIEDQMAGGIAVAAPPQCKLLSTVEPAEIIPGPRLPHELVSLEGAGISRILRAVPDAPRPPLGSNIPGWVIASLVTATILAGCMSLAFYAIPGLASPTPKQVAVAPPEPIETPPIGSPLVEVTGIRIVTGSSKGSEIRYLVVNHSAVTLDGATINVTLRLDRDKAGAAPISRFSFTAPGLRAYESREMLSPIQNLVSQAQIPDWRELRADVQLVEK